MSWFKRVRDGILTRTEDKKEAPDGIWSKCPECNQATPSRSLEENFYTCPSCEYHFRMGSEEYFGLLFDKKRYRELFTDLHSADPLEFTDSKPYPQRIQATQKKTNLKDAIRIASGKVDGERMVICCMDFAFIGGSMGSVMGEKISRAIDHCVVKKYPLMIISKSGGARMMEGALSLMQMAKVSAKLNFLADDGIPYFSLLTDPTTGGVTASFAMLGDFNMAEPNALIGFAGPRIIKETIGKDLPEGFQRSEFVLDHGFVDFIIHRNSLKMKIASLTRMLR